MHRAWGRILLIGAAGLGCLLSGIGVVIGLDKADQVASVIGACVGVAALGLSVYGMRSQRAAGTPQQGHEEPSRFRPHLWVWPGLCVLVAIAGAAVVVLALELSNPASAPNGDLWMAADRLYTVRGAALAKIESTPEATPARCAKVTAWVTELGFTGLRAGDQLCARSTEGRYAMLRVDTLPSSPHGNGYFVFYGRVWKS